MFRLVHIFGRLPTRSAKDNLRAVGTFAQKSDMAARRGLERFELYASFFGPGSLKIARRRATSSEI